MTNKKAGRQFACSKMMLPEHCENLQKHHARIEWEEAHRRNFLDEQEQWQMQCMLEEAVARGLALNITILDSNGYQHFRGVPLRFDPTSGEITLDRGTMRPCAIKAVTVVRLEL